MPLNYAGLIPDAAYLCACGVETHEAENLTYYNDKVTDGEGFYCTECIEAMENDRFREVIVPLREQMVDELLEMDDINVTDATEAARETFPFEEDSGGPSLQDVLTNNI